MLRKGGLVIAIYLSNADRLSQTAMYFRFVNIFFTTYEYAFLYGLSILLKTMSHEIKQETNKKNDNDFFIL